MITIQTHAVKSRNVADKKVEVLVYDFEGNLIVITMDDQSQAAILAKLLEKAKSVEVL